MNSDFSMKSAGSPQSVKIFFKSFTFSFVKSTALTSICFSIRKENNNKKRKQKFYWYLPYFKSQICGFVFASLSRQIFSTGIPHESGLDKSPIAYVADVSNAPI